MRGMARGPRIRESDQDTKCEDGPNGIEIEVFATSKEKRQDGDAVFTGCVWHVNAIDALSQNRKEDFFKELFVFASRFIY
jgi:hypothetical protein